MGNKLLTWILDAGRKFIGGLLAMLKLLLVSELRRAFLVVLVGLAVVILVVVLVGWLIASVFGTGWTGWGVGTALVGGVAVAALRR